VTFLYLQIQAKVENFDNSKGDISSWSVQKFSSIRFGIIITRNVS